MKLRAALAAPLLLLACTQTKIIDEVDPSLRPDSGAKENVVAGSKGTLFGGEAESYAKLDTSGKVVAVGFKLAKAGLDKAPKSHPFQDDLVLAMPDVAVEQTMAGHLRMNWLPSGHSPTPYGESHWDLHFMQGTEADTDKVDCRSNKTMPGPDSVPPGYAQPTTSDLCVPGTGYHVWPTADKAAGATFSASIIMGFWAGKLNMIEPMITKKTLDAATDFEVTIAKPKSTGFGALLYPTHLAGHWDEASSTWSFELDRFEALE